MKEINDLKNRLQKFEADNISLQQEVIIKSFSSLYLISYLRINVMKLNLHDINNN